MPHLSLLFVLICGTFKHGLVCPTYLWQSTSYTVRTQMQLIVDTQPITMVTGAHLHGYRGQHDEQMFQTRSLCYGLLFRLRHKAQVFVLPWTLKAQTCRCDLIQQNYEGIGSLDLLTTIAGYMKLGEITTIRSYCIIIVYWVVSTFTPSVWLRNRHN